MREHPVAPVLQLMLKKFKASDLITGPMMMTIPAALSMIIGPIVSFRSDRHRSRLGCRVCA
ncbi:hypothetical protein EBZ70_00770 [bacterium]|jgi:hypothetical protein|nr:hypothetical protein [bacterium]